MSIASRIEQIEQHISDDYSILTLGGADLTNVDKNIQNLKTQWKSRLEYYLANGLDVVWNNWEKVSGSGTTLSINNTIQAPMKIVYGGNTYQYATTGKNLFPIPINSETTVNDVKFTPNEDGSITVKGTSSANYTSVSLGTHYQLSAGTYILSCTNDSDSIYAQFYDGSNYRTSRQSSFTLSNNVEGYRWAITIPTSGTVVDTTLYPQLEKNYQATSFEKFTGGQPAPNPDYPQDIQVVSGDNSIVVCGKNLFDDSVKNGKWINTNGSWSTSAEGSNLLKVECSSGDVFSLSATFESGGASDIILMAFFDENDNMLSRNVQATSTSPNLTRTAPTNTAYMWAGHYKSEPLTIQLERGETTTYEPYQSQSYPINLGNIELCKIGTYQDKIFKNTPNSTYYDSNLEDNVWYLNKQIDKYVFTGRENWNVQATDTNFSTFQRADILIDEAKANNFQQGQCLSNFFKTAISWNIWTNTDVGIDAYVKRVMLTTPSSIATTKATLNQWLSSNNVLLYYVLATPTYTKITDQTLIYQLEAIKKSYNSQTNISQTNADKPFELDVVALGN